MPLNKQKCKYTLFRKGLYSWSVRYASLLVVFLWPVVACDYGCWEVNQVREAKETRVMLRDLYFSLDMEVRESVSMQTACRLASCSW